MTIQEEPFKLIHKGPKTNNIHIHLWMETFPRYQITFWTVSKS